MIEEQETDESLWSDDDTEGPSTTLSTALWRIKELENQAIKREQEIRDLRARIIELEEIEAKRVQHDFKPASTMASTAPTAEITVPASLFPKFVIASHGATQIWMKVEEGKAKEVVKK